MAKCKNCGKKIIWLQTKNGKMMPCDDQRIPYREDPSGSQILMTSSGNVVRGHIDLDSDVYGYTSHFATCPSANFFRRYKE